MNARAHVYVSGRVQGVFFRSETHKAARSRGVSGWVRNTPEGRVEAVFEGRKEDVEEMIRWCHKGSPIADVEKVDAEWEDFRGEFDSFSIRS